MNSSELSSWLRVWFGGCIVMVALFATPRNVTPERQVQSTWAIVGVAIIVLSFPGGRHD